MVAPCRGPGCWVAGAIERGAFRRKRALRYHPDQARLGWPPKARSLPGLPRLHSAGSTDARGCAISYQSPYVSLDEAMEIIAQRLEASGWPRTVPRRPQLSEWRRRVIELEEALACAAELQRRRPVYAAARAHVSAVERLRAARREMLEAKLAEIFQVEEDERQPHPPHGSIDEAKKQLREPSFDGLIVASGICSSSGLILPGLRVISRQGTLEFEPVTIDERDSVGRIPSIFRNRLAS